MQRMCAKRIGRANSTLAYSYKHTPTCTQYIVKDYIIIIIMINWGNKIINARAREREREGDWRTQPKRKRDRKRETDFDKGRKNKWWLEK